LWPWQAPVLARPCRLPMSNAQQPPARSCSPSEHAPCSRAARAYPADTALHPDPSLRRASN
jgi:hypothetical protein